MSASAGPRTPVGLVPFYFKLGEGAWIGLGLLKAGFFSSC